MAHIWSKKKKNIYLLYFALQYRQKATLSVSGLIIAPENSSFVSLHQKNRS